MTKWSFHPESGRPLITISCNGRHLRCILDTGYNNYLWMGHHLAERHHVDIPPETEQRVATMAGGDLKPYKLVYASKILFEGALFEDVPIQVFEGGQQQYALLGMRMLMGFVVTLDCNEGFTQIIDPALRTDRQ